MNKKQFNETLIRFLKTYENNKVMIKKGGICVNDINIVKLAEDKTIRMFDDFYEEVIKK